MSALLESVRSVAASRLAVAPERLDCLLPLDACGVDSLARIDLMFAIEDHFNVAFTAQALRSAQSLSEIAACVAGCLRRNFLS